MNICRSHHYGYEELVRDRFDAKLAAPVNPPEMIQARFLAAVLRIADILELDPERTPEIVLQQRDVSQGVQPGSDLRCR
ncbi:MAG TPA: hypothetical protein VGF69_05815 [Thermoanaerobaculia bacterium]